MSIPSNSLQMLNLHRKSMQTPRTTPSLTETITTAINQAPEQKERANFNERSYRISMPCIAVDLMVPGERRKRCLLGNANASIWYQFTK